MNFEYDLVLMSLVIFAPSAFALLLLFIPRGGEEAMRWCALFGTAVTLVLSLWMFIDYYQGVVNFHLSSPEKGSLNARAEQADKGEAEAQAISKGSDNWVARRP